MIPSLEIAVDQKGIKERSPLTYRILLKTILGFRPAEAHKMKKEAFFRTFSSEAKIKGLSAFIEKRELIFN